MQPPYFEEPKAALCTLYEEYRQSRRISAKHKKKKKIEDSMNEQDFIENNKVRVDFRYNRK